jgi:anti-anti-sigma factor
MPGIELRTSARDRYVVVALRGDLDVTGTADAEAAIAALMAWGQILIIDMSALDFIDCASLGVLLKMQRQAWSMCGNVVLAAPQRNVLRLLALAGKDQAFWVHASVKAAATALLQSRASAARAAAAVSTACPGRAPPSRTTAGLSRRQPGVHP